MIRVVLIFLAIISFCCKSVQSTQLIAPPTVAPTAPDAVSNPETCGMRLSDEEMRILTKEKIVFVDQESQFLISRDLTSDCEMAHKIGYFFWAVISGRDTAKDRAFAQSNAGKIVAILRSTWKSGALSSDGVAEEKYALLQNNGLPATSVGGFVQELLETEDLFPGEAGLQSVIINRSFSEIVPVLRRMLKSPEVVSNLNRKIFVLIALHTNSPTDSSTLKELRTLSSSEELSATSRQKLRRLIGKLERKTKIDFKDVDDLELAYF